MPYSKSKWTPFAGMKIRGKVNRVVLRNKLAVIDGKVAIFWWFLVIYDYIFRKFVYSNYHASLVLSSLA